jgi:hypothetical protein
MSYLFDTDLHLDAILCAVVVRYEVLSSVADMIENASAADVEGGAGAGAGDDANVVLVSKHTAPSACITVTGILDKVT